MALIDFFLYRLNGIYYTPQTRIDRYLLPRVRFAFRVGTPFVACGDAFSI